MQVASPPSLSLKKSISMKTQSPVQTKKYYYYVYLPKFKYYIIEGEDVTSLKEYIIKNQKLKNISIPTVIPRVQRFIENETTSILNFIHPKNLISIFNSLVCENQVVFLSYKRNLLSFVIDLFVSLMKPLEWNVSLIIKVA